MAVDIHAHFFPATILEDIARQETRLGVSYSPGDRVLTFPARKARPLFDALTDLNARRRWNAERGIASQVLSPWMDVAGDELRGSQAAAWTRIYNDGVAAEIEGDRAFTGFATLPMDDGRAAADELNRCVRDLGFAGAAIPTQAAGRNLDEARLDPLFEAAQDLDVPLFLHPFRVLGAARLGRDFMTNICGNPFETTVAAMSLFFGGVIDRFPRLRILLSHGGGTLPLLAGRAAHGSRNNPMVRRRFEAPDEMLKAFFYDTLLHDVHALGFAVARVGAHRCALGTDVPFPMSVDQPLAHLEKALATADLDRDFHQIAELTPTAILRRGHVNARETK